MLDGDKWLPMPTYCNEIEHLVIGNTVKNGTNPIEFETINTIMDKYVTDPLTVF